MNFQNLSMVAAVLVSATALALLLSQNWRWSIIALALQYLGVFWLVGLHWQVGLAAVKLVTGWMVGAILGASQPAEELVDENFKGRTGLVFRGLAAALLLVVAYVAAPALETWFSALPAVRIGSLTLIGLGLMQMGMTTRPLRVVLGLLTTLSGFEVLYAVVESSVMVAGLISAITLGLALVAAYLIATPAMENIE